VGSEFPIFLSGQLMSSRFFCNDAQSRQDFVNRSVSFGQGQARVSFLSNSESPNGIGTAAHRHIGTVFWVLTGQPSQHQPVQSSRIQPSHLGCQMQQLGLAMPVEALRG